MVHLGSTRVVVLAWMAAGFWVPGCTPGRFRETVDDPSADFTEKTGLPWPSSGNLIKADDTHGGFHGDGDFYLVFSVDKETFSRWKSQKPPWGASRWERGPVPSEIASRCMFGDAKGWCAPASTDLFYVARARGPESMRWHNGDLLVLDPEGRVVWLYVWDF